VVEVVVEIRLGFHESESDALAELEVRFAVSSPLDLEPFGERCERPIEVPHAQSNMLERAALARAVGGEESQLAPARVGTDERKGVRPVDHMHAEVSDGEVRHGVAVCEPVRDVVEGLRVHDGRIPPAPMVTRSARCGRRSRLRSAA
jgi:hypothetical protein